MKLVKESIDEYSNTIKGGKGDELNASDVNSNELELGIAVEMEHTNNKKQAKEIALDHLSENPKYYSILINAGLVDEPEALNIYKKISKNN